MPTAESGEWPEWATWLWGYRFLPQKLHTREGFEDALKTLHMEPLSYAAMERAILGILN